MARLDSFCSLNMGQSPDSSSYNEERRGIPFFQGNADFGEINPTARVWCDAPTKIAHKGDILISVRAPIGALNIANTECCIGRGLAALTVNETVCEKNYLWYAIASKVEELNSKGTGSTFKAISKTVLAETDIPLPNIEKQKQIVSELDGITHLISNHKELLDTYDEMIISRFIELFGDLEENTNGLTIETLDSLCKVSSSKRIMQSEWSESGVPFLRISDINNRIDKGEETNELYIPNETYNSLLDSGLVPESGDILITSRGTLGKCYIVKDSDRFYFQDGMISWLSNIDKRITSTYLSMLFSMPFIQKQIEKMQAGSTVAYLSISMLRKMKIVVPSIEAQNEFIDFVEQTNKAKKAVQESLDNLEILKKSLMQKYFG